MKIIIDKISEEEFLRKKKSTPILSSRDMFPRSYYLIKIDDEKQWLVDQVDVGLKSIPYKICDKFHMLFVAATFNLFIIDCYSNKVVFEYVLTTPCIEFFDKNEIVYVICETEIVYFSLTSNNVLKIDKLCDMVDSLEVSFDKAVITLENGEILIIR